MLCRIVSLALAGFIGFAPLGASGLARADSISAQDRTRIESIIHDYLLKNPEIIQEVIAELEKKQAEAEAEARNDTVTMLKPSLFESPRQIELGNPKGDVTIVEFFDYNCTYCRHALPDMNAMLKADPKLRFILKEWPVLGPDSVEAARVAVAVRLVAPDKYSAFHNALLGQKGRVNAARAIDIASSVGIDATALSDRMKDREVDETLTEVDGLSRKLGLNGTPSYVLGSEVVFGAVGADELTRKVAAVRQCGKTSC